MKLILTIVFLASTSASQLSSLYLPVASTSNTNTLAIFNAPSKETSTNITESSSAPSKPTPVLSPISLASAPTVLYGVPLVKNYAAISPPIAILRNGLSSDSKGAYSFEYETANHIIAKESGKVKAPESSEVQGSYSYLAPNGQVISLSYVANENGFQPSGDHLPTPPPIPKAILRSLALNAAEEARGIVNDGQYLPPSPVSFVSKQVVVPSSVATQYLPPVKSEAVLVQRVVGPTISPQYIPPVTPESVVSTQNGSPSTLNLGYKY